MISYRAVSIKDSIIVEIPAILGDIIARVRVKRARGIKADRLTYTWIGRTEGEPSNRGLISGKRNLWATAIPTWPRFIGAPILTIGNPVVVRVDRGR